MKTTHYISKGIVAILLVVMTHSYMCSIFCSVGMYSCCNEQEESEEHSEKSCSGHNNHHEEQDADCQIEHLVFFSTIGQYHFVKAIDNKILQSLALTFPSTKIIQPVISKNIVFAYNGFHPPPPKENILILVQSFLI